MSTDTKDDTRYKNTIDLPKTDFPMRGNGPVREPEFQKNWVDEDIYQKVLAALKEEKKELFVLHDGPPYLSSDKIHIGTALNKILKDIIIKYKTQRGFQSPYIPGYDSHGLPIENAVVKSIKGGRAAISVLELREKCKEFALNNLKGQEENFKRLGILGDWQNPYITLAPEFEAEQIRVFAEMANKGYIYRGLKPVYWSYGAETALADAEVEYNEAHKSKSIYVAFPVTDSSIGHIDSKISENLKDSKVIIWTTTAWTIPGNLAICLNPELDYQIYSATQTTKDAEDKESKNPVGKILIATALAEAVAKNNHLELEAIGDSFKGIEIAGLKTQHPLFERESPIIFGDHVTTDAGTGCVHTAPGHGQEDFLVGQENGLDILCPVNGKGYYTEEAGQIDGEALAGIHVLEKRKELPSGTEFIIEKLKNKNALLGLTQITHSYPYCWRSKTPLLYRATSQWFASVDGFRAEALAAIKKVKWIPERGEKRIYSMVEDRGDWCISRQRTWGVPIPVFYDKRKEDAQGNFEPVLDLEIIEHIAEIFAKEGSSAWYAKETAELIPQQLHEKYPPEYLIKETDTMDVWFDSGSSHRAVVAQRKELSPDGKFRKADLYLEGSDQHRGWFQSSLLTSVATNGDAPYHSVLTHGFVMDEKGRKMSKSLGNVVDPQKVIKQYGADILRLWVASVDYSIDIKVGDSMFKQLSDIYRNLRNTARYMLGNLDGFDPAKDTVAYEELWDLDRLALHKLQKLVTEVTECFDKYQFFKYYQLLQNFCAVELSAFYFDILKDRLYTHGTKSKSRRAAQTVIAEMLAVINRLLVPVLPHLAEDIYNSTPAAVKENHAAYQHAGITSSILASKWPQAKSEFINEKLAAKWEIVLGYRDSAYKAVEAIRKDGQIGKSLEAGVKLEAPVEHAEIINQLREGDHDEILAVFMLAELEAGADISGVTAYKFEGEKCVRCWKHFKVDLIKEGICPTCTDAIKENTY